MTQINYKIWINIFALAFGFFNDPVLNEKTKIKTYWDNIERINIKSLKNIKGLFIDITNKETDELIMGLILIPWQDMIISGLPDNIPSVPMPVVLYAVTPFSVIYKYCSADNSTDNKKINEILSANINKLFDTDYCIKTINEQNSFSTPDGIQVISFKEYPYYINLQVSISGSTPIHPKVIKKMYKNKMIFLSLIPEIGTVKTQWLKSVDTEISISELPDNKNVFADYEAKITPDNLIDFSPSLYNTVNNLPYAKPENLSELLVLYKEYSRKARRNKGSWEDGNIVLGAQEKEYLPSEDELLLGEIGERILEIKNSLEKVRIKKIIKKGKAKIRNIKFLKFTFIHYDVMGSGRFFYVDSIEKIKSNLLK